MSRTLVGCLTLLLQFLAVASAQAHENWPGYLLLRQTGPETYNAVWKAPAIGDLPSRLQVVLPPECRATSLVSTDLIAGASVDRWSFTCPGGLIGREIQFEGLRATTTDVLVRIERSDGSTQTIRVKASHPSFTVDAAPTQLSVAASYLTLGIEHILGGVDHLLFVLGLLFIVRRRTMLVKTITAFTIAHSLTLAVATLGYAYPHAATLNALIAMSILFLGPEMVRAVRGQTSLTIRHPWIVAFLFGLLHGFGFASGLADLGIPSSEIPFALVMFNLGVEIGQLGFIAILLLLGASLTVLGFSWSRFVRLAPAYIVGSLGAAWTIGRVLALVV